MSFSKTKYYEMNEFLLEISEARYLFDRKLSDDLFDMYFKGVRKVELDANRKIKPLEENEALELKELDKWFNENIVHIHERFNKYLDLKQLK